MIKIAIPEAKFKDERRLTYTDWEKVPVESLNGLLMSNYYASNKIIDSIPKYLKDSNNQFPTTSNFGKRIWALFSRLVFGGNADVAGGKISLEAGRTLELKLYPNAEPFISWDWFEIETNSDSKLAFKMQKLDNTTVFSEQTFDSVDKKIKITLGSSVSTELKEMIISITNKGTSSVLINNITYQFTVDSRLTDLLSDINAGFLNGMDVNELIALFLSKITPQFLANLLGNQSSSMHPVGSIYMSVNNNHPSTLFGGSWVQIQGRFLLASGAGYGLGGMGGSATHVLNSNEIPAHNHNVSILSSGGGTTSSNTHMHRVQYFNDGGAGTKSRVHYQGDLPSDTLIQNNTHAHTFPNHGHTVSQNNVGGSGGHNNMPPYQVVNMWYRTA